MAPHSSVQIDTSNVECKACLAMVQYNSCCFVWLPRSSYGYA